MKPKNIGIGCKILRSGNGLGIQLPREAVDRLNLKEGESVNVRINGDTITIRRSKTRKKWTEKQILKGVTPAMCGQNLIPDRTGQELI